MRSDGDTRPICHVLGTYAIPPVWEEPSAGGS